MGSEMCIRDSGYAQLLTAFMIFAGLAFIAFRIWRETAKARRSRGA